MAFAARLGALTEELVEALLQQSGKLPEASTIKGARDAVLHRLKSHTSLRTNQFEVANTLNGLEERFRINCRDLLADALRQRLDSLQQIPSKWHPDILHLLLELSDQPVQKTRLSDLEALNVGHEDTEPPLRWEDIAKEDGWAQDPALWSSIRYSDSSDDEVYLETASDQSESASEPPEDEVAEAVVESLVSHPEHVPLWESLRAGQEWRKAPQTGDASIHSRKTGVQEIQAIREVLFMLQGLPTTMFDPSSSAILTYQISHLTWDTHKALINSFSEYGRQLGAIRQFAADSNCPRHMHAFQDALWRRLRDLDLHIIAIETRLAQVDGQIATSLIAVKGQLDPLIEPFSTLAQLVGQIQSGSKSEPFRYLEILFDAAAMAQISGQPTIFEFLTRLFLDCFNAFLRPIRLWMDEGRLIHQDVLFFVRESVEEVPTSQIWQDRFMLRKNPEGSLHTPHFLRPSAQKIFIAGKNIVVLRQLGKHEVLQRSQNEQEPTLSYETVCPAGTEMAPFPELFGAAFERWIQSKYRKTSQILKDVLFESCQLNSALDALQHIYLMSDGSAATHFCDHLFSSIEGLKRAWSDRYTLTVVAQDAFADKVESTRLTVSVRDDGQKISVLSVRESVKTGLPGVILNYRLSWPVQMILTTASMVRYQEIFTFLLQIKRSLYALRKMRLLDSSVIDWGSYREDALFYSLRNSLLWFTSTVQTYLTTLVLVPNTGSMRRSMETADDVDAIMSIHDATLKEIRDDALLGNRVAPIRQCILDILDLGIKLERIHAGKTSKIAQETDGSSGTSGYEGPEMSLPDTSRAPLREIKTDFDRHLRFICEGLRSVARASSNSQSSKWDMLADMLQTGIH